MDPELQDAFNDQIALELASAYAYLQMGAWFEARDLVGFASWMREQWSEETTHATKFIDYLLDRDGEVVLQPLTAPQASFDSPLEVIEHAHAHERRVTASIGALYALAQARQDFSSLPLLGWFLNEQVEEESSVRQIVGELRLIGADTSALLMLDRELPGRRRAAADQA